MKSIALYSNKGGVGKTASAVNLAYLSAISGYKTLLCDLDPQSSATYYYRIKPKLKKNARLLRDSEAIENSIKATDFENLDLLPGDFSHRKLDNVLEQMKKPEKHLRQIFKPFGKEYDIVFFDCPPTINNLAESIFQVVNHIVVPLIPTTLSIRAHYQLIHLFEKRYFEKKKIRTFFSMVDRRKKMHTEAIKNAPKSLGSLLKSSIPYSSKVELMGEHREPVCKTFPKSSSVKAYNELWNEITKAFKL